MVFILSFPWLWGRIFAGYPAIYSCRMPYPTRGFGHSWKTRQCFRRDPFHGSRPKIVSGSIPRRFPMNASILGERSRPATTRETKLRVTLHASPIALRVQPFLRNSAFTSSLCQFVLLLLNMLRDFSGKYASCQAQNASNCRFAKNKPKLLKCTLLDLIQDRIS